MRLSTGRRGTNRTLAALGLLGPHHRTAQAVTTNPPAFGHCDTVADEFWYHVSPQAAIPIAPGANAPANLDHVLGLLTDIEAALDTGLEAELEKLLLANPGSLPGLRLLAGRDCRA